MPRKSYVYDPEQGRLVPKDEYYAARESGPMIQPDIEPFKSIIDGEVISSRSDLRRHMKKHDVVPTAEFSSEWSKSQQRRIAIQKGEHDRTERISALRDAYEHVRNQERARSRY